jgi:NADPH:quinone reductase-like Zn-dependent oxidoreductase
MLMTRIESDTGTTMQAVVRDGYGSPDVLSAKQVERPIVPDDGVLVRVVAASLNAFVAKINQQDLDALAEVLESGAVRSVIDRRYALNELADALRYLGEGHATGKVIVAVQEAR